MGNSLVFSWMFLLLLLEAVSCYSVLPRARREIPLDFEALAEIPVEHFGLIDDYGVLPKHPSFRRRVTRQPPAGLVQAGKSKRDEPDIGELYYDDLM
ncbi:protein Frey 1 [Anomaloglossus baeobatrachus]|uniref:protein Frey 1 n=1 Tax=Anomaloglossus baeobatrachus TaxID=238106 RepID=UPI003F505CEF